jgi:hypothetical protein
MDVVKFCLDGGFELLGGVEDNPALRAAAKRVMERLVSRMRHNATECDIF